MATINHNPSVHPEPEPKSDYHTSAFTLPNGCPIDNPFNSEKVQQKNGNSYKISQLLQESFLIDQLAHFAHERIPERLGHAKGTGAYGVFEVTSDEIKDYTCADFLQKKPNREDNKTPFLLRLSTTSAFRGSADTVRDTRGFGFKFYTNEGNLDWVFFFPRGKDVFGIWDPGKIISNNHVTKKCPASGLSDPNMVFHFINNNPEAYNSFMRVHSDEGTPRTYQDVTISGINTYTFVKDDNNYSYVRITMVPEAPKTPFTLAEATKKAGEDPDYHNRTLFNLIADINKKEAGLQQELKKIKEKLEGHQHHQHHHHLSPEERLRLEHEKARLEQKIDELPYPRWRVNAHIIKPEEVPQASLNIFDASKALPKDLGRIIEIGRITLNRNPRNQFAEVEQAAFSVANVVPGWDVSPDPILQSRLFAYGEAHRHRLGANADQLPVNRPKRVWDPTRRDGPSALFNYEDIPTYIAEFDKTLVLPGTNVAKSYVGSKCWEKTTPVKVKRGLNERGNLEQQLEQPWEYYCNDLNGAPPAEDQDPVYKKTAHEKKVAYKQWAFVHNTASHLWTCRDEIRQKTYEIFRKMDTVHWKDGEPTTQNLGKLVEDETEKIIKDHQNQNSTALN